jgi:hypothetical protein
MKPHRVVATVGTLQEVDLWKGGALAPPPEPSPTRRGGSPLSRPHGRERGRGRGLQSRPRQVAAKSSRPSADGLTHSARLGYRAPEGVQCARLKITSRSSFPRKACPELAEGRESTVGARRRLAPTTVSVRKVAIFMSMGGPQVPGRSVEGSRQQ